MTLKMSKENAWTQDRLRTWGVKAGEIKAKRREREGIARIEINTTMLLPAT